MVARINRTRIIDWIGKLKPFFNGYKGYTWKLLQKQRAVEFNDPTKESWIYSFMFYDRNGEQYCMKHIGTELDDKTPTNNLAIAIIDFDGGFYVN